MNNSKFGRPKEILKRNNKIKAEKSKIIAMSRIFFDFNINNSPCVSDTKFNINQLWNITNEKMFFSDYLRYQEIFLKQPA